MSYAEENSRNQELVLSIQEALEANDLFAVREALASLHPSEVADLLESLPSEIRDELWVHVEAEVEGDVLAEANDMVRAALLENMESHEVAAATASLDTDEGKKALDEALAAARSVGRQLRMACTSLPDVRVHNVPLSYNPAPKYLGVRYDE